MKKSLLSIMLICFAFFGVARAQQALPYSYGFEDYDLSADGWTSTAGNALIDNGHVYEGSYAFRFNWQISEDAYLISPVLTGGEYGVHMSFYYLATNSSYLDHFQVGYTTDASVTDPSAFTYESRAVASASWQQYETTLPAGTVRVAILYDTENYNDGYYLYLDSFSFEAAPNCLAPTEFVVSSLYANRAVLTWASEAENFNFEYKPATQDTWVPVEGPITVPTYMMMFLDPETEYNARVQAVCDDENSSLWTKLTFTTPATCPAPTDLTVTTMLGQGNVATLSWTDNGDETTDWQICLNEDMDNLISFSVGGATYMFTDLIPETTYTAKVRANCGDEDGMSAWSNTVTFTPSNAYRITVNEGTTTNEMVPIYGYWCDSNYGIKSQFIIPAADLAEIQWATLNKLTFYASNDAVSWGDAEFEVYMKEVNTTTFDDATLVDWTGMEKVMDAASLAIVDGEMEVTLSAPYQYLGGNLVIGFNQTVKGSWTRSYWYGVEAEHAAIGGYSTSLNVQSFLPKTSIDFIPGVEPVCFKPTLLAVSGVTNHEATLSWTSDAAAWVVEYDVNEDFSTMLAENVTGDPTLAITGLDASTTYYVRVKAVCDEGDSDYSSVVSFTTKCDFNTTFPWNEDFESYAEGVFDAPCWENEHITGTGDKLFNINEYGELMLPDMNNGTMTKLVLPGMSLPNDNYMFSIAVYRSISYSTYSGEGIRVFVSTDGELEGATELAFIPRVRTVSNDVIPAENYDDFFTYHLPIGISGPCYIILRGESQYGTATYLDNFSVKEIPSYTKTIEGHHGEAGHYYLIASPIRTIAPTAVEGLIAANVDDYDLYYFNQEGDAEGKEWINYKPAPFNLEWSKGYLYASKEDTELVFKGAPHFTLTSACSLELDYVDGAEFAGFNLVGNPYAEDAVMNIRTFYTLRGTADFVAQAPGSVVYALEGVAVIATSEGEYAEFYLDGKKSANAALNVSQNGNLIDRAIMSFEGQNLPKIQLNPNHTKVYMPVEGKDFAVASVESFGEMPVNFKAENDGSFTMDFTSEEVGFSYLHLIDNLTGADVDLLANPSYSFNAKNSDYANRFKLVFVTNENNQNNNDNFAYMSNGNIIVNGEGTLQVIDMTGRIVSTSQINGVSSINLNAAAGVYVLQLTNGNEVKTQKIVVK